MVICGPSRGPWIFVKYFEFLFKVFSLLSFLFNGGITQSLIKL